MMDLLSSEFAGYLTRSITILASTLLLYYALKCFIFKIRMRSIQYNDIALLIIPIYWLAYSIGILVLYHGNVVPPTPVFVFNTRFGILITLSVISPLFKDRLTDIRTEYLTKRINLLRGNKNAKPPIL